jgi:hypothetical protein
MKNICINAIKFDPFGVVSIERFVTPDFIRGYSDLCPSGTAQSRLAFAESLQPVEAACS